MRLLILAYDFPPNTSVGAQRPYGWFRYLKEFGIHPVVVTRHWDEVRQPKDTIKPCGTEVTVTESELGTIIRVPFRPNLRDRMLLRFGDRFPVPRKILSLWFTVAQYFVASADNRRNMYQAAREYLKDNPCNAVIATGEPFILFHYANMLSKDFKIPWVADYRDGWSMNYHAESGGFWPRMINDHIVRSIERKTVSTAKLISVAAPDLKSECRSLLVNDVPIQLVMNGFLEDVFKSIDLRKPQGESPFIILHSGTLYPYQPVEIFLDGLKSAIDTQSIHPNELQMMFLGLKYQPDAVSRVSKHIPSLIPYLSFSERMPHPEAIEVQSRADMFLLLASPKFKQIYAKVFDYVALRKPVLLCQDDCGPCSWIIDESGVGIKANSAWEVSKVIIQMRGVPFHIPAEKQKSAQFSRKHQTGILANLIKTTLKQ